MESISSTVTSNFTEPNPVPVSQQNGDSHFAPLEKRDARAHNISGPGFHAFHAHGASLTQAVRSCGIRCKVLGVFRAPLQRRSWDERRQRHASRARVRGAHLEGVGALARPRGNRGRSVQLAQTANPFRQADAAHGKVIFINFRSVPERGCDGKCKQKSPAQSQSKRVSSQSAAPALMQSRQAEVHPGLPARRALGRPTRTRQRPVRWPADREPRPWLDCNRNDKTCGQILLRQIVTPINSGKYMSYRIVIRSKCLIKFR